jgi:hypothetical protein
MKTTITSASSGKHQVTTAAMKTASASISPMSAAMKTTRSLHVISAGAGIRDDY